MVNVGNLIERKSDSHSGHGAGPGSIDEYVYKCPCSKGTYVVVKDNIPGFRDTSYYLNCDECLNKYNFNPITGDITEI